MKADPSARRLREAQKAMTLLEGAGHAARLAGGCVRDRLLGLNPADYDVATDATPDAVQKVFAAAGLKTVPTGIEHGTVTLVMPAGPIEITTLRVDVETDGRRAAVRFGTSFEEDAARRDFTINAMFEDRHGAVFDYFDGKADLAAGVLRFVGEPEGRIREDYLRILRFFRFKARFGFEPAPGTLAAIAKTKEGLARISQERITSELLKTAAAPHARRAFAAMRASGVTALVLPELAARPLPPEGTALPRLPPIGAFALFLLWGDTPTRLSPDASRELAARLRLSRGEAEQLAFASELLAALPTLGGETADRLDVVDRAEKVGGAGAYEAFFQPLVTTLAPPLAKVAQEIADAELVYGHRRRAKLPLDGRAVQAALGIAPGPALGVVMDALKRAYRNGQWASPEDGLALVSRIAPQALARGKSTP